jgi:hypothetical protein
MKYLIEKVTLIRESDGRRRNFSFDTSDVTDNIEKYRHEAQKKYNAKRVHLNYQELKKNENTPATNKVLYHDELQNDQI